MYVKGNANRSYRNNGNVNECVLPGHTRLEKVTKFVLEYIGVTSMGDQCPDLREDRIVWSKILQDCCEHGRHKGTQIGAYTARKQQKLMVRRRCCLVLL